MNIFGVKNSMSKLAVLSLQFGIPLGFGFLFELQYSFKNSLNSFVPFAALPLLKILEHFACTLMLPATFPMIF